MIVKIVPFANASAAHTKCLKRIFQVSTNMYFFTVHVYLSIFQFECLPAWSIYIKSHFLWHPEGLLKQMLLCRETFIYTQMPLTQKRLHIKSWPQRNRCTEQLSQNAHERFYAQKLLHAEMFDTEKQFHRAAFAHTYGSFFAHGSFYTLMPLHRAACTRRSFCTRKPLHRSFLTEKPFHREAFLDRGFHT